MRPPVVVWGLLANSPFGGMTWQVLHHLEGLRRLGFDVWYVEDNDSPLLRPGDLGLAEDLTPNVRWLERTLAGIGLEDRWILRLPGSEDTLGHPRERLDRLYREAVAVFNLCGAHWVLDRHEAIERIVLLETDPGSLQVHLAHGNDGLAAQVGRYSHLFTYGANIGREDCPLPTGGFDWIPTRPPVVVDWWSDGPVPDESALTTVATWGDHGAGKDVEWNGERWRWRKDVAFEPYRDLPARAPLPLELALQRIDPGEERRLRGEGWRVRSAADLMDPAAYRDYVRGSVGEFTAVKEQYTRTRSGWVSDRSACYLAAGRPVVSESTGAEEHVPAGAGMLTFADPDEAAAAIEAVAADPRGHGEAAKELAREHFEAERVLRDVCERVGIL